MAVDIFEAMKQPVEQPAKSSGPVDVFEASGTTPGSSVVRRYVADPAISLLKSAIAVPETVVGLADIPTGGYAGKLAEQAGFRPKEAKNMLNELYSPEQKAANYNVEQAKGFVDTLGQVAQNPSVVPHAVLESVFPMLAGGVVSKALPAAGVLANPAIRGAIGEGVVGAGSAAEQIRQEADDGTLSAKQSLLSLASGAGTSLFGAIGGKVANRLGIGDVETMLASGAAKKATTKGYARSMAEGALSEGALEELPQSLWEQAAQNLATGRPLTEGLGQAGAMGLVTGAAMGAGGGAIGKFSERDEPAAVPPGAPEQEQPKNPLLSLPSPTYTGTPSEQMVQQDVERQKAIDEAQANADRIYGERDAFEREKLLSGLRIFPEKMEPVQALIDSMVGVDIKQLKGIQRTQYEKALDAAFAEPIGVTQDKNGLEIPFTMGDYLKSTVAAADYERASKILSAPTGAAQQAAESRLAQVQDEEATVQPDIATAPAIPVVGPLSAAANQAVQSGVAAQMNPLAAALQPAMTPQEATRNERGSTGQGQLPASGGEVSDVRTPGTGVEPAGSGTVPAGDGPGEHGRGASGRTVSGSGTAGGVARPVSGLDDAALGAAPEAKAYAKDFAERMAARMTQQGMASEAYPHPTREGMFAIRARTQGEQNAESRTQPAPVTAETPAAEQPASVAAVQSQAAAPQVTPELPAKEAIDTAAHEAATSPQNDTPLPTEAQKSAGNYKVGRVSLHGLDISIENPQGSTRSGTDPDGKAWETTMAHHYGYIRRTEGNDGDHVDTFIGPNPESQKVFVVDQKNVKTGAFDEHKVLLGFDNLVAASAGYAKNYDKGWVKKGVSGIKETTVDGLKDWLKTGDMTQPFGKYGQVASNPSEQATAETPKTSEQAPAKPIQKVTPIMRRDDLVGAIMRITGGDGIAANMAETLIGEKANKPGNLRGVFTNRGTADMGELAMHLRESEGYDVRDASHLEDLIREAAAGNVARSMARQERDAQEDQDKQYRDQIRSRAKKYGIKTVAVKFSDLEKIVLQRLEDRHNQAVASLDDRSQQRFNAALEEAMTLVHEAVVDETLADVNRRGLRAREFWNEATRILRGMVYDAKQEASNATEQPTEEIGDGQGNSGTGRGTAADQRDQASAVQSNERAAEPAEEQRPGLTLEGQTPAEVRAQEAQRQAEEARANRPEPDTSPRVKADQVDLFNTQGGLFNSNRESPSTTADLPRVDTVSAPVASTEQAQPIPKTLPERIDAARKKKEAEKQARKEKLEKLIAERKTAKEATKFIKAPDGSIDFGEITPEMAKTMRRQAGKIRLEQGVQNQDGTGHGLVHIEARHGKQIRSAGYASIEEFVLAAVRHIESIWKPGATTQIVAVQAGAKGKVTFLELQQASDSTGDYYRVNSAFPAGDNYLDRKVKREGWKPLWNRDPVSDEASGATGFVGQSPNAGETTPTVSPQSGDPTIANETPAGNGMEEQWDALPELERYNLLRGRWNRDTAAWLMKTPWADLTEDGRRRVEGVFETQDLLIRALTGGIVSPNEYPTDEVKASFNHVSHSPGDGAYVMRNAYLTAVQAQYEAAAPLAETEAQREALAQAIDEFKAEYLQRDSAVTKARGGSYSGLVAGGSRLNTRQVAQRGKAYDRAGASLSDWLRLAADDARNAVLAARSSKQLADESAAKAEKAANKHAKTLELIGKIDNFKKGDEVRFGNYNIAKVSKDRDGYPSSVTVDATDLTDNRFDLARTLFNGDKAKLRALVDEARATTEANAAEEQEAPGHTAPSSVEKAEVEMTADWDSFADFWNRLIEGKGTIEDVRKSFALLVDEAEAFRATIAKMKNDQLKRMLGWGARPDDKKADLVRKVYEQTLDRFTMNKSAPSKQWTYGEKMEVVEKRYHDQLRAIIDGLTDADLAEFRDSIAENSKARKEALEKKKAAAADPKTLEDFEVYATYSKNTGKTPAEARKALTPEQRATWDSLLAEKSRGARQNSAANQKAEVKVASVTTEGQIIETKHTKTGEDLFVVKAAERVERDVYNHWNATAKRLGGWYSSFRGNGAVPGFQFKTRENADAFLKFLGGDVSEAKEAVQERRDAFEDDKSQSAVERLNDMANRLDERADESLGRERKANTERRARFAASAESAARSDKALAATMRNIATAIQNGTAKFLDRVRQKAQVEMLHEAVRNAKDTELRDKYPSYADQERHKGEPATADTAEFANWPTYTADRSDLANLGRRLLENDGTKKLGQQVLKIADDVTAEYKKFAKENLHKVSVFSAKREGSEVVESAIFPTEEAAERAIARSGFKGKATTISFKRGEHLVIMGPTMAREAGVWEGDDQTRITLSPESGALLVEKLAASRGNRNAPAVPWKFQHAYDKRKRLAAIGIETPAEYRSALREYIGLREAPAEADKIKQMERAMIGRKNDGLDFFPTSEQVVQEMLEAAELAEGMSVLEPSAGMGHIAERIRESGIDPDVVELSNDRKELLEAKGFNVVGRDFMAAEGAYDRIIMNPPFSDRRDAQHVQHAYSLLKPGGRLVAIMGEGVFFGQDAKAKAFREWLEAVGGTSEKLPDGSFLDPSLPVNTGVSARMVVVDKPAGQTSPVDTEVEGAGNIANRDKLTPADKAIYGMAAEGKSAADILQFIASGSRSLFNRQVAKLLLKTGIAPSITVGDSKGWKFHAGEGNKYAAGYNPNTDTAALFRPAAAERNVLHELVHAATLNALGKRGLAAVQMKKLFEHVQKSGKLKGQYGMANVEEFVSEAFTNPKFQQALKNVSAPAGSTGLKSAWHWFVRVVRGILGLNAGQETALSAALEIGVGVIRENMQESRRSVPRDMIDVDGKMRPSLNSEGRPIHPTKEGTRNFWRWYEQLQRERLDRAGQRGKGHEGSQPTDSGIPNRYFFDDQGRPRVLFHGTSSDITTFDLDHPDKWDHGWLGRGIYLGSDPDLANFYAGQKGGQSNVMPLYAGVTNPYVFSAEEKKHLSRMTPEAVRAVTDRAMDHGHDGGVLEFGDGSFELVAFKNTAVKSASGNTGDFDASNTDIRYNLADDGWSVSEPSKMDDVIYALQDKHVDTKRVVQSIMAAGKKINDAFNPYLQEELFHGRAAKGVKDFLDLELRPLLAEMQKAGVDMGDFEEFLWNRHAEERNRQIAKINPEMQDGGSGINTADAKAYLAGLNAEKRATFDALAQRIDAINRNSQGILVSSGLEKQETIDAWNGAYQHYVPLQREDVDSGHIGTGKGFSVRGSSTKRAMGSGRQVVDIIANITMQRERNIVRAEKNRVSNALMGLAVQNPNVDFWTVDKAPKERVVQEKAIYTVLDADGQKVDEFTRMADAEKALKAVEGGTIEQTWGDRVEERVVPGFTSRDNVLLTRVNGEDHYITFNERDERAMRMATALKNLDADNLGRVLSVVGRATRYLASINTQYNPVFGVINLIRDAQGALLNLASTPLAGDQKRVLGYTKDALVGIYKDIRAHRSGKKPSSNWAELFEEFQNEGGQTGYRDQYANAAQRAEAIRSELKQFSEGKAKQAVRGVFGWLSDYNETMENAVRLAAYKAAKEKGISNQQAASLAKNITVNFNRKGQMATQVGALYAFFNASVQGTARIAETLFEANNGDLKSVRLSKLGKKIITGGIMLGSMQALLLAAAGYDDDEPPDFVRERNLILPIGDGKYLTLAMPLGFHVLPGIGRIATEFVLSGGKAPMKRIAALSSMFADTFNPIGNAGFSLQTITPSVVDPFAALAENKDFTGKEIYRENFNSLNPQTGNARAKDVATFYSKWISTALNWITGGSEFRPGLWSPSPDALDYLIGQVTGGVGREANKVFQTGGAIYSGEDLPLHKVPLVGRFIGDTQGQSGQSQRFYEGVRQLNMLEAEYKGLLKSGRRQEAAEFMVENPGVRLIMMGNYTENQVRKLREQKRVLVKSEAPTEAIRAVEQRIMDTMRKFNERVSSVM